jgi:N-acetylneuraminate lyase
MTPKLTGLIAAPFTAFNPDASLNLSMIERQAEALVGEKVIGGFVCGTTGEGVFLTTPERLQVAERWMAVSPANFHIIVHVGHQSVGEGRALAAHAQKIKAHAFATTAPTFFRVTNIEQLVDYCAQVASAAPALPFYYYNIPSMTGLDLPMIDFLKAGSRRIPNLAGIKFTHENLMDYSRCVNFEDGRFDLLFGRDESLLAAVLMGAKGAVGSTYNFMAPIYYSLIEAFNAGDVSAARRFQLEAIEIIGVLIRYGALVAGKAMMKMIGLDCGPVRAPLQNLSHEALEALTRELKAVGFPFTSNPGKRDAKITDASAIQEMA